MAGPDIPRRTFLLGGAALAAGAVGACLPEVDGVWSAGQALCSSSPPAITPGDPAAAGRVLEIHDPRLVEGDKLNAELVAEALTQLLLALTGTADLRAAWTQLIPGLGATHVVGIKVNVLNPLVPTRPEVVKALVGSLKAGLGLPADRILVWDRRLDELTRVGLTAEALGAAVEGTWDTAKDKGGGRGYEVNPICLAGREAKLSNILTRRIDHLINLAVVKRHDVTGFTGCLKNHYGTIDNPGDFHDNHERRFERALPALNAVNEVVTKSRLYLLDATFGVCKGGTDSPVDCVPGRLVAGLDPLAVDVRARQIRDEAREALGPDPETLSQGWIQAAERAGIGSATIKLQVVP